jgi:hypothetical protein
MLDPVALIADPATWGKDMRDVLGEKSRTYNRIHMVVVADGVLETLEDDDNAAFTTTEAETRSRIRSETTEQENSPVGRIIKRLRHSILRQDSALNIGCPFERAG